MDRRSFLTRLAVFSGGLAIAGTSLGRRAAMLGPQSDFSSLRAYGFGELVPTRARNTGETVLALPRGFEYDVIGRVGTNMSDKRPTPPLHDGMWTFKVGGELRLVRNHEVSGGSVPREGSAIGSRNHYDEAAGGGTTTLIVDRKTNAVIRDFVSLSGTLINCAGGPTPWGSWISCEETTLGKAIRTRSDGRKTGGFSKPHGYCFEVPAAAESEVVPLPLKEMGRFVHEAVAVDRKTGIVYLTEDFNPGGFYRFVPRKKGRLHEGGTLQMLAVEGRAAFDTRTGQKMEQRPLPAVWITIGDPDPEAADVDPSAVYKQGASKGGAAFGRLEGCEIDPKGNVYFTSTSGGDTRGGQIWIYSPSGADKGHLRLAFESPAREILHMPDNIALMPGTHLLFICEDSDYLGELAVNHVRVLTRDGKMADFAKNINKDFPRSEFAGSCFSLDGGTFFVNSQRAGITLAISGDWKRFKA